MLARVLQTLQMSIIRRHTARRLAPRTPVLARVLQTLQMSIRAAYSHVHSCPTTPVLARVLQTLQMSVLGGIRARLLVPRTPVLVRVLQTLQMSIRRHSARPLVPRTPVLVRVLQTLQMSIPGGSWHVPRPKDTRARARTSNTPNVHSWRHSRTSPRSKDTRARARTSNTPDVRSGRQMSTSDSPTCTRTRAPTARVPSLRETPRTPARSQRLRSLATGARPARRLSNAPRTDCRRVLSPTAIAVAIAVATVASRAPSCRYRPPRRATSTVAIDRSIDRSVRVVTLETGETPARVAASAFPRRDARARCPREVRRRRRDARARPPSIDRSTRATRDDARRRALEHRRASDRARALTRATRAMDD